MKFLVLCLVMGLGAVSAQAKEIRCEDTDIKPTRGFHLSVQGKLQGNGRDDHNNDIYRLAYWRNGKLDVVDNLRCFFLKNPRGILQELVTECYGNGHQFSLQSVDSHLWVSGACGSSGFGIVKRKEIQLLRSQDSIQVDGSYRAMITVEIPFDQDCKGWIPAPRKFAEVCTIK